VAGRAAVPDELPAQAEAANGPPDRRGSHARVRADRSGKGVSICLPLCLTNPDSMVVNDPKSENHDVSAGARKRMGHTVIHLNPWERGAHAQRPERHRP